MNVSDILARYEVKINACRARAKTENEIIVEVWTRICQILEERALNRTTSVEARKYMRYAAREIRAALVDRSDLINTHNVERLKGAERQCYYVAREVLEDLVRDHDTMYDQAQAGHTLKRRLNAAAVRVRHVIETVGRNIENLKMGNNPEEERR